jgi:hypothetical protein
MGGLYFTGHLFIYGVSNITFQRCYVESYIYIYNQNLANTTNTNVSKINIAQNFINYYITGSPTSSYTITNVTVNNNITYYVTANTAGISGWVVQNNTFFQSGASNALSNSTFDNNLITSSSSGSPTFPGTTFTYNVSDGNTFSSGTGNQINYDVTSDRIASGAGISTDETYQLKAGSALKTAASDGGEVGAFGGATPYVISGIPPIPSITNMVNTGTGTNTITITVNSQSNN